MTVFRTTSGWPRALVVLAVLAWAYVLAAPPLSGAIFTTTEDGTIVNENVRYEAKEDVYLDGGPGPNAPSNAAGLPEGDYYFQVTDPSGKDLLSTDHISCRKIHVNDAGVISHVFPGTNYTYLNGKNGAWIGEPCQHAQGVDADHAELGAITVQLYPYDDTPNPGGVYKVWITPVDDYAGPEFDPAGDKHQAVNGELWQPGNVHGFIPAKSKTDNYKVKKKGKPFDAPEITVRKFHDKNMNGTQDEGEEELTGWKVSVTDPTGVTNDVYTPATVVAATAGDWVLTEATFLHVIPTVSRLDGAVVSLYPTASPTVVVSVAGTSGETHAVVFGNVDPRSLIACKVFDRDADGVADEGEPGVPGWQFVLTGTTVTGDAVGPETRYTGEDGCVTFPDLLPGTYTVKEVFPTAGNWTSTDGATEKTVTIESSLDTSGEPPSPLELAYFNICFDEADFGTKGYWHNKNGLEELEKSFIDDVNLLDPYAVASDYFDDGDEPFDGEFTDGTPVEGAFNDDGDPIWGAGTWQAEVSRFLVDANAGGDPREQLAQQLLAFLFNVEYRLGGTDAVICLSDGTLVVAGGLIDAAIDAWANGTATEQDAIKDVLDALNNNDAVKFVPVEPCTPVYD